MKKIFLISVFLAFVLHVHAVTYYVSATGNDANNGTSILTPWKTTIKVSSTVYSNGDIILFRRGDVFEGTITLTKSSTSGTPIIYGAYGSGAKPIITTMQTLSGWTLHSGKIYKVSGIPENCDIVTVDGVSVSMGKYPQNDENTFESYSGITSITDNQLTGSPSWTGAEVVIWKSNWTIDRGRITNHSGTTITYTSGSSYAVQASGGQKYYVQRSLAACTYHGAWFCDGSNFYMYFDTAPTNYVVKAGVANYTIYGSGKSYNTFRDIEVQGGNLAGIYVTLSNGFSFKNSILKNTGLLGITATNSTSITKIDSCNISYVNGTGISIISDGSYIGHNTIDHCGQFAGMGQSGGGSHYGIYSKGVGNVTEYNTITNTGYIPIYWVSSGSICRYNIVDNYPTLGLVDGGGVYTYESTTPQTTKRCYGNVISNSTANGLYSDGIANNVEFHDNIVYNVDKWGIHMNESFNNSVHDNVFYDCGLASIDISNQYALGSPAATNNSISGNLAIQKDAAQKFYSLQDAQANNILSFGTSNNNTFIADPSATTVFFNLYVLPSFHQTSYTFSGWKTLTGFELGSIYRTEDISTLTFIYNDTHAPKIIPITGTKTDLAGEKTYQTSHTLQPYTSLLLLPATVAPEVGIKKIIKHLGVAVKHGSTLVSTTK